MPFVRLPAHFSRASLNALAAVLSLAVGVAGQSGNAPAASSPSTPPDSPSSQVAAQTPIPVMKVATHMVSVEVVARDHQGHPVTGLTAKDFQISEQVAPKKDHRPQAISVFQATNWADLSAAHPAPPQLPPGVYSNLVNQQKTQAPPTVLLFDGINTDVESQMQVHHQMVKILGSIPTDVPVAVFLMGDHLLLLQSFTTDATLLREAAAKTLVVGQTAPDQDPLDDPDSLSAKLEGTPNLPPGVLTGLKSFENKAFSFAIRVRMQKTLEALRGIARYLDGYPGRKNVLWISSSFPLMLWPADGSTDTFADLRDFQGDMQEVGTALMDAKIAIYPMDPGGVKTQSAFEASSRVRQPSSGARMGQSIQREDTLRQASQQTMSDLAEQTGGRVCISDNDLGDCVRKAVDDASSYYELGYYPDAGAFRGEYHRIVIKTTQPGVHLSYREGYYARSAVAESAATPGAQDSDPALHRAACEDPLTSTAVLLMAKPIPADQPDAAKYFLAIDSRMLTFTQPAPGNHELGISVGACTFDKTGQPLQYLQKNSLAKLNDQEYASASHGITQTFQFLPKPGVARVRLLVRDSASGRIGSVEIPYAEPAKPAPALTSEPAAPVKP